MKHRTHLLAAALAGALALAGGAAARLVLAGDVRAHSSPAVRATVDGEDLDRRIAVVEARARRDPFSAADQGWLAQLLLQRARETGSAEDVTRAEAASRASLRLRDAHNASAWGLLASALVEQHRFGEALEAARTLVALEPENAPFRALMGEIQLELGDYAGADSTFGSLETSRGDLDVAPRLARWAEIGGRTAEARALLRTARDRVVLRTDVSPELVAWFQLRVGDFELRHGELDAAEEALRAGLEVFPGDRRLLAAMARLEGARGRWKPAIDFGERAVAAVPEPGTLALLSDLYAASGDAGRAAEYARVVEVSLAGSTGAYHRAESLFLLDHGRRVPAILEQARADLRTRRDVYGHDLLAWALHRAGRDAEARAPMAAALARGTRDPMLLYHAGMIEKSLGDTERSREHLRAALRTAPGFHPVHARLAREALACQAPLRVLMAVGCD